MNKRSKPSSNTSRNKGGRPSSYKPEHPEQARKLCMLNGATDKDLAEFFGVSERTINYWKVRYPQFLQSIKEGKVVADAEVAHSLYRMAVGYTERIEKPVAGPDGVEIVTHDHYFPPQVSAAFIWLKNRKPEFWKDKHEIAVSGTLTGPEREEIDRLYKEAEEKSRQQNEMLIERRTRLKLILGGRADSEEEQNP